MKNLICAVLIVLSICVISAFVQTVHAAQQGSQVRAALKPLQQPLVANQSAMLLPLCSILPQAIEKVEDTIHDLHLGLNCEGHFNEDNFYNYRAQVNSCCSPQKSFSV